MKFVYASTAQLASVLLLTQQHTPTFVHGVPSGTYHISTAEHEDYEDPAVSITNCFHLQELNWGSIVKLVTSSVSVSVWQ